LNPQQPGPDDDFSDDLNPEPLAGTNYGGRGADTTEGTPASDIKELYGRLPQLSHAELAEIPVVPEGTRLEQGKTYVDLNDLDRGEFRALASMRAEPGNRYVAKDGVSYDLWNKLRGRDELAR
jgi:hypothetical protein